MAGSSSAKAIPFSPPPRQKADPAQTATGRIRALLTGRVVEQAIGVVLLGVLLFGFLAFSMLGPQADDDEPAVDPGTPDTPKTET